MDFTWWYQNTTQLMDSDPRLSIQSMTVEINNGFLDTTSTLTIPSVDRADAGNYTCVASNTVFGSLMQDVQQFMLTVNCKCLVDELLAMACVSLLHTCTQYWLLHFVPCSPNPKSPSAHFPVHVVVVEVLHDFN